MGLYAGQQVFFHIVHVFRQPHGDECCALSWFNAAELVAKAPADVVNHRLARAVIYDYSSERSVDASVDLDTGKVVRLHVARTQPMLSRDEEAAAIAIALADEQVKSKLAAGDAPQVAMHYWSRRDTSLAYSRRAAAVLLGQPGGATSVIAVVDLLDNLVCEIVPAAEW